MTYKRTTAPVVANLTETFPVASHITPGRMGQRICTGGQLRRDLCADLSAAGETLLARQKRRRGYMELS